MPEFFQMHQCNGYRAKVTVEWSAPDNIELMPERAANAEEIAADVIATLAPKPLAIVQAMLGRKP